MMNFRHVIAVHALEILHNPMYRKWKCNVKDKPGYGIIAVGPDKTGIIGTRKIML